MLWKKETNENGEYQIRVFDIGEYSLRDTLECGQCFRFFDLEREGYDEFIVVGRDRIFDVAQHAAGELIFFGISEADFLGIAVPYFSLDTDFSAMREDILGRCGHPALVRAADGARGIAILRQDAWEALFSFIISQNNNIPRIKKIIREVAREYGVNIAERQGLKKCPLSLHKSNPCQENCKNCGICYSIPTPSDILREPEKLLPSHPGFRYRYLLDAAHRVASGEVKLESLCDMETDEVISELRRITGVGEKVASCVALFGLFRLDAFPVDVWMKRAISDMFSGELPVSELGPYRGIAQQYIFHYIRNLSDK